MVFNRFGPLESATCHAAFVFASLTDSLAIHPEFKVKQLAEFLNENYVGIPRVPSEEGKGTTRKRDGRDE
jgi:hypothetical protein